MLYPLPVFVPRGLNLTTDYIRLSLPLVSSKKWGQIKHCLNDPIDLVLKRWLETLYVYGNCSFFLLNIKNDIFG